MAKWHAMVTQMQHKVGTARRIWAREFARHAAEQNELLVYFGHSASILGDTRTAEHSASQGVEVNRGGEGVSHAQGRSILGSSISGTPKIEQNFDRADRNGKAVTHAEGRSISGTSILGAQQCILGSSILGTPKIERDFDRADRNEKAVTHAEGRSISGTSILGVRRVPKI